LLGVQTHIIEAFSRQHEIFKSQKFSIEQKLNEGPSPGSKKFFRVSALPNLLYTMDVDFGEFLPSQTENVYLHAPLEILESQHATKFTLCMKTTSTLFLNFVLSRIFFHPVLRILTFQILKGTQILKTG